MRHIFDKQAIPSNKMMIEEENIDLTWAEMAIVSFANGCAQSKFLSMCKTVCVRVNGCGIEDKQQVNILGFGASRGRSSCGLPSQRV